MANPLDKVINLIKKTGDNCIVLDSDGNPAYVVSSFDKYEASILGGADQDRSPKVDKKIDNTDTWNSGDDNYSGAENDIFGSFDEKKSLNQAENSEEDKSEQKYYFEPID